MTRNRDAGGWKGFPAGRRMGGWGNHHSNCISSCVRRDMLGTMEMKRDVASVTDFCIQIYNQTPKSGGLELQSAAWVGVSRQNAA